MRKVENLSGAHPIAHTPPTSAHFCYDGVVEPPAPFSHRISAIIGKILYISTISGIHVESLLPYIFLALAAFATTYVLTPVVKKIAIKLDAVDYPSKRRVNTVPTPRMGGLAVFAGLIVACALQIFGTLNWGWPSALVPHPSMDINYPMLAAFYSDHRRHGRAGRCRSRPKQSSQARLSPPRSPPPAACSSMPSSTRSKRAGRSPWAFSPTPSPSSIWLPIPISSTSSTAWTVSPPVSPPSRAAPCSPSPS